MKAPNHQTTKCTTQPGTSLKPLLVYMLVYLMKVCIQNHTQKLKDQITGWSSFCGNFVDDSKWGSVVCDPPCIWMLSLKCLGVLRLGRQMFTRGISRISIRALVPGQSGGAGWNEIWCFGDADLDLGLVNRHIASILFVMQKKCWHTPATLGWSLFCIAWRPIYAPLYINRDFRFKQSLVLLYSYLLACFKVNLQ